MANEEGTLKVLKADIEDEKCVTFVLDGEDHTLGNALRYIIMRNPRVKFCGYSIPHPSEKKIHLRIQMQSGTAVDALETGLRDLKEMFEHMESTFMSTVNTFKEAAPSSAT